MSDLDTVKKIKNKYEQKWLSIEGVVALGIGFTTGELLGIIVSVNTDAKSIRTKIPQQVEGFPVEIRETDDLRAL